MLGFTADAAAFPDSAGVTLELYVRIPPATLADLVADTSGSMRLRLSARLKSAYGALQHQATEEIVLASRDTAGGFGQVVSLHFPARPGQARLQVKLEDLHSRRPGLVYLGRRVPKSSAVEGDIQVPTPVRGRVLSDLEFAWSERPGGPGGSFRRADGTVIPNPERLYGLYQSEILARFVARGQPGDVRPWHWQAQLLDSAGHAIAAHDSSLAAAAWIEPDVRLDIASEPAGGYDLDVRAWQEGDSLPLRRRAHLSVGWKKDTWLLNPRDVQDVVHFLFDPDEEEKFETLAPGEQERMLDEFWRQRDPTPETAVNEAYETFRARVDHANQIFTRVGMGKGMFSDMGRVYIRYGAPSEVYHQVIPTGSETLEEVINQLASTETRALGDIADKVPGGDLRPYELWIYDAGTGLPPDADPRVTQKLRQRRIVFLFVDEQWLGEYRLVYSTE